jgi:hypothetical protein
MGFVDEVCGTVARLCAYVMTLTLMAIGGIALWQQLPVATATAPSAWDGWAVATRSAPAFAVSRFIFQGKTEVYESFRHREGGRKDVFHWSGPDSKAVAELEIYAPATSIRPFPPSPKSPHAWTRTARSRWRRRASSTANSAQ